MQSQATYIAHSRQLNVKLSKVDNWIIDRDKTPLNPMVTELSDGRLYMRYKSARYGTQSLPEFVRVVSDDDGASWISAPLELGLGSGRPRMLSDGTIMGFDSYTQTVQERGWNRVRSLHVEFQEKDPIFILRHCTGSGISISTSKIRIKGLPWAGEHASYVSDSRILEHSSGRLLAAFICHLGLPKRLESTRADGTPEYDYRFTTFVIQSDDYGSSWKFVEDFRADVFQPTYTRQRIPAEEGFDEPALVEAANGDVLFIIRTGSHSPLFQARSADGGMSWSSPESIGWPSVAPDPLLLHNGVLACASGRGFYGQPQLTHVMFSLDGSGRRWEYPFAIHTGSSCSYTSMFERDGKLNIVYSEQRGGWNEGDERSRRSPRVPPQLIRRATIDAALGNV